MPVEVAVSLIGGAVTLIVALLEFMRRQNNKDHQTNASKLDRVLEATQNLKDGHKRIEDKIDTHINDHARGDV
jgi:hypothetical protein